MSTDFSPAGLFRFTMLIPKLSSSKMLLGILIFSIADIMRLQLESFSAHLLAVVEFYRQQYSSAYPLILNCLHLNW